MAWTAPTTRVTGTLITAAIWNTDLVDNLDYLKTEVDKRGAIFVSGTEVLISNSTTETTLITGAITGGSLSSTGFLIVRCMLWFANTSGGAVNKTIRLKYGTTTICTENTAQIANNRTVGVELVAYLRNDGATNAQEAVLIVSLVDSSGTVSGFPVTGTAAIDSTANQTLALTIELGTASASYTCEKHGAVVYGVY